MSKYSVGDLDFTSSNTVETFLLMISASADNIEEVKRGAGYISRVSGLGISSLLNTIAKVLEYKNWSDLLEEAERKSGGNRDNFVKKQCFVALGARDLVDEYLRFSEPILAQMKELDLTDTEKFKYICESFIRLFEIGLRCYPLRFKVSGFTLTDVLAGDKICTMVKSAVRHRRLKNVEISGAEISGILF